MLNMKWRGCKYINYVSFRNHLNVKVYWFMVFNDTFNNISAISWQSVLLVKKTGIPDENHWPVACYWPTLSHNVGKDISKTVLQSWRMWRKFYQSPVCNGLCFRFLFWSYLLERCCLYSCCTSVRLLHLSDTVLCCTKEAVYH